MKRRYFIGLACLVALLFACYGFTAQSKSITTLQPATIGLSDKPDALVEQVCSQIYEGNFAGARALVESTNLAKVVDIINEYEKIEKKRSRERKAAYQEQITELEKLQAKLKANDINDTDTNDVNDIAEVLSTIHKAREFANERQKKELLSNKFVQETIQRAIDKAAELELEGKWIEAYSNCYLWLTEIDPDNEGYSDYTDLLIEKAGIAASLEDNPCETREERFQGVEKIMFIRTIVFLDLQYVDMIDYKQMFEKAIERCELLAEVVGTTARFSRDEVSSETEIETKSGELSMLQSGQSSFVPPDSQQLAAWSKSLRKLLNEVKSKSNRGEEFDKRKFLTYFEKVLGCNEETARLPEQVLIAQFAEASLASLDPYTVIVWPRQVQDFEKIMTNEFTGIGIEISKRQGLLTVASLLPDTPAYKGGLDAGDVIEEVNGVKTKDMTLTCAVRKITGPKGTRVTLTIKRPGEEKTRKITITRDRIIVPTIRGWQRTSEGEWRYMLDEDNKVGYVRLMSFSAETASSLENVLLDLEAEGLKGLILDLRSNTGGLLDSAVEVADKFIGVEEGTIVKRQPGFGRMPIYELAHKRDTHPSYPMVILVNSNSASASEIVAGALADDKYERAILVGTRTHGKGSVQSIHGYPGGGAQLKYTMAHYHLPSDQRVESKEAMKKLGREDWGVAPDVEIELTSDELKKMIEVQRDNDVLVQADHDNINHKPKKYTAEETLDADPQLATGLLIIRSKLIQNESPVMVQKN